jgi:hypothetical protein
MKARQRASAPITPDLVLVVPPSTVCQSSKDGNHQAPGAGAELPARIHDALDDGEQVEGRAGETVYPRHGHHVAGDDVFQELQKLAPVGLRAAGLLAVELCAPVGAKLVELRVKRLPVGADAGRIRGGGFAGLFRSYLSQTVPLEDIGAERIILQWFIAVFDHIRLELGSFAKSRG